MEENTLPKLRYADFEDAWQKSLLIEQVEIRRGLTYKPSDVRNNGVRVLRSSNIAEDTFVISDDDVFVDKGAVNIPRISNGDILVTAANGSTKLVGKHAIVKNLSDDELAVHGGFMLAIKAEQNTFVNAWMSSKEYKKVLQFIQGGNGAIGNLSTSILKSMKMTIPASLEEQSAIGSLFRTLDDLLAVYKEKLTNYQDLKSSMLSKMFPKSGQNVPEIRLAGFGGEWKRDRADKIFKSVSEKNRADLPVLSASQVNGMVLRDEIGIDIKYDNTTLINYKVVKPNQFVIHLRSFQGGFALSKIEGITSPAYTIIDFVEKDSHCSEFWNCILTSKSFIKLLETVTYGIRDGKSISFKDFSSLKFMFPEPKEQLDIANFFSNLDTLINSYQDMISQLETLKKKLLQDMLN
ncbi:restriction endonuclease subunit S [Streptococcus sanguinis]|uniref:restriction endonuclease subunit S n=1 Tax=Streptococcus sanguinis TaxID=1305 RepID=UPI000F683228|nr:restriction endonuclease subunit S [Streptococcus sanguinis]RSI34025.1 Type I restriction modification DNA specificity domain protein [Streptococcus sanguinis]